MHPYPDAIARRPEPVHNPRTLHEVPNGCHGVFADGIPERGIAERVHHQVVGGMVLLGEGVVEDVNSPCPCLKKRWVSDVGKETVGNVQYVEFGPDLLRIFYFGLKLIRGLLERDRNIEQTEVSQWSFSAYHLPDDGAGA